ncbi:MAG: 3-oxoacyl-(acyl-carrier-protein) reductase, partial [Polaromonas sp.]|nr:3-oxoacyl-(acyl-carrier-protein) reductase [Polaromonas sp.]
MTKQRALVTGTSSGIGLAIAEHLLDQGWAVSGLDMTLARITHPAFEAIAVDLRDTAALEAVAGTVEAQALVHAAGVLRVGRLGELAAADAQLMWEVHVRALSCIANIVVPKMVAAACGRVVILGSRVSQGFAGRGEYAATKAALNALARSWAAEVVASGVTVNVVSPAATRTAMLDDPSRQASAPRVPPMGRLIEPSEIASMVAYLLSPAAAAITGQDLQICGGSSL